MTSTKLFVQNIKRDSKVIKTFIFLGLTVLSIQSKSEVKAVYDPYELTYLTAEILTSCKSEMQANGNIKNISDQEVIIRWPKCQENYFFAYTARTNGDSEIQLSDDDKHRVLKRNASYVCSYFGYKKEAVSNNTGYVVAVPNDKKQFASQISTLVQAWDVDRFDPLLIRVPTFYIEYYTPGPTTYGSVDGTNENLIFPCNPNDVMNFGYDRKCIIKGQLEVYSSITCKK